MSSVRVFAMVKNCTKTKSHCRHILSRKQIIFKGGPPIIIMAHYTQTFFNKFSLLERFSRKYTISTQWGFFHDDSVIKHYFIFINTFL
ncbi:hypothetical protein PBCV1_a613R [Paramecium bursaria Chlorella virus 1]|uniref:Uncharacterized protein n=1 Tax=Paramecium bursaria Chlorella virus 1 TaxID=10506 RepID=O41095_PBCV1|nr:hypothetical protein PBCV1_a613R [Paramecium bursaria Chlorella virus 1]AAC97025.1 hypothetical protein [Paramecium bursaria Chlorella virus 1]